MTNAPLFFLPEVTPEAQESAYTELANWCRRPAPIPEERVYSITYVHDRDEWTATVGERLRGTSRKRTRSGAERIDYLTDQATVLAIFPSDPFVVFTNAGNTRSAWENPFYVGRPKSITYFSVAHST
jgi:hypothetical protein